jgi:hypothetical protein
VSVSQSVTSLFSCGKLKYRLFEISQLLFEPLISVNDNIYYAARDALYYIRPIVIKYVNFHTPVFSILSVILSSSDAYTASVQDTSHTVRSVTCTLAHYANTTPRENQPIFPSRTVAAHSTVSHHCLSAYESLCYWMYP